MTTERQRLLDARAGTAPWRKWGPYLSERQWGTVREDYSADGNAWAYFSHDQARSRAYRWGEDGLAGIADDGARLCFALALWNGNDPILKERLFGLTNTEGNHGEDVKEYYFYLDSTPTHSYMRYLYKYPQREYPYGDLVATNAGRSRDQMEYELLDTGVFDDDRYFDVQVEYAKAGPDDILIRITASNRGSSAARLHLLPTLWFRNTWSAGEGRKPTLRTDEGGGTARSVFAEHETLGAFHLFCDGSPTLLFTENETNARRLFGTENASPYVKDAFHEYLVQGRQDAVNPQQTGTKCAALHVVDVPGGASAIVRLRLAADASAAASEPFGSGFDDLVTQRRAEADDFYGAVLARNLGADEKNVMRQALAGMLWTKQYFYYDVNRWLAEHGFDANRGGTAAGPRNAHWHHMDNADIISMPDKWEYPWFAAWDLAFHVLALSLVDEDFAKGQLDLMIGERYVHPNGQLPAYEWNFGDVNPPVHAFSTIFTYRLDQMRRGRGDIDWLERSFHKLALNFTWWVNRKDRTGNNAFEGGFLGLDNIGVFDRSAPLPTGGYLEQADGTAWMALFCQNMVEIASELALHRPAYKDMAVKFVEHFLWIANSLMRAGEGTGMWDDEDGFFYDVLRLPDGGARRLKVRSMVGLLPLCAVTVFDGRLLQAYPEIRQRFQRFLAARAELCAFIHDPAQTGCAERHLASVLSEDKLRRVLARMLDEAEFLGPHGIRALSRYHEDHPYVLHVGPQEYRVAYLPAESDNAMFGGNSNWRGPVWMPVNALIVRALLQLYMYHGDRFRIECPTGSGREMTLYEVAQELVRRLSSIFLRDAEGRRPVYGGTRKFQEDPHWRDLILFYEYFHGDNGAGLGASHQTGWTGVVATLMQLFATNSARQILELGKASAGAEPVHAQDTDQEHATS